MRDAHGRTMPPPHLPGEQSRKYLANLDNPNLLPVINDIRNDITDPNDPGCQNTMLMLPSTISTHTLYPYNDDTHTTSSNTKRQLNCMNNSTDLTVNSLQRMGISNEANNTSDASTITSATSIDDTLTSDDIINAFSSNYRRRYQQNRNNRNNNGPNFNKNNNHKQHNRQFHGRCEACNGHGHHKDNCFFLKKSRKCLELLANDGSLPSQLRQAASKRGNCGNCAQKSNVVRSLIDSNFIPYDSVDLDIFINVIMDGDYFALDSDEIPEDNNQDSQD